MIDPRNAEKLRAATSAVARRVGNMVRRMTASVTVGGLWNLDGYPGETSARVELFPGVGYFARPPEGAKNVEVIVLHLGESHPVIVATRDEDVRLELDHDESAIFNSTGAWAKILKSGDIEFQPAAGKKVYIRSAGGSAAPVVTLAEHNAHTHPSGTGPTGTPTVAATGTTTLEAE